MVRGRRRERKVGRGREESEFFSFIDLLQVSCCRISHM